jgi:hypothetical protein
MQVVRRRASGPAGSSGPAADLTGRGRPGANEEASSQSIFSDGASFGPRFSADAVDPWSADRQTGRLSEPAPRLASRTAGWSTIGVEAHEELRQLQALLRREIPSGDPGLIFERALHLLLEKVEKAKFRKRSGTKKAVIRSETDNDTEKKGTRSATATQASGDPAPPNRTFRTEPARSRHIPAAVRAAVWKRDGAQCAFVGGSGHRCIERSFVEFHHGQPFALQGPPTIGNIALRCRRHNHYEGELDFGTRSRQRDPEGPAP